MQPINQAVLNSIARIGPCLLIAACLAVVVLFVLLGQYAHPASDDFCLAAGIGREGLITHLWNHYFEWSGRYSGNALYAVYPMIFGLFEGYRFIPVFMLAGLFLAAAFFLSTLFRISMIARPVLLSSFVFVAVYLLGLLSPASSLYWMAGALSYQTANILLLVILGLMIQLAERQNRSRNYFVLLGVLLLVLAIAVGSNETGMLAITAVAILAFILHMRSGWVILKPWLLILITALACFAIVYFSPGNAIRAADFPLRHDLARAISGSLSVGSKMLWIWLSSPVLIVSSVLAPFAITRLNKESGRSITVSNSLLVLLPVCTFALAFLLQFPAWWAMGGWPPARTLDAIYFLFLLGWFSTIAAITLRFLPAYESTSAEQPSRVYAAFAIVILAVGFTLAVLNSPGIQRIKHDLFHTAGPWHEYMNQRYLLINQALADERLYLAVPDFQQEYPRSLYFNDIMYNPGHWRNECYAGYFGLKKIRRDRK